MKAIILAAGKAARLGKLCQGIPKCLLEINGTTILENCIKNLKAVNVSKIVIVVGYLKELIMDRIGDSYEGIPIEYIVAIDYQTTNNIVSLWHARYEMDDDLFLIESDIFFGPDLLKKIEYSAHNIAVVTHFEPGMSGTVVTSSSFITRMILGNYDGPDYVFKTVNIYSLRKSFMKTFVSFLNAYIDTGFTNEYYEVVLADIIEKMPDLFVPLLTSDWAEVDDIEDLHKARYKFGSQDEKYNTVMNLYGYFWPYGLMDYCHLYNMYFPPQEMIDYIQVHLPQLITTYPSAHREIAYYLSEWLGIKQEYLSIGNGASELIRILGNDAEGFVVSTPSFNEFETATDNVVKLPLEQSDWKFNHHLFLEALNNNKADYGIIVSPNNPTSIAVDPQEILLVLKGTDKLVIVDESFIDFSNTPSMLPYLEEYSNLIVMKSLGKAFGICGLRLGFIASTHPVIKKVCKKLPIWNINNFAETFLRQVNRYDKNFKLSCEKTKKDRDQLYYMLSQNNKLKVWKPDANFLLCKVLARDGTKVCRELFDHNILVKTCSNKTMDDGAQYLRIGCRTPEENERVVKVLENI